MSHMWEASPGGPICLCRTLQSRAFMDAWLGSLANLTAADPVPWEQAAATELVNTRPELRAAVSFLNATYLPSL